MSFSLSCAVFQVPSHETMSFLGMGVVMKRAGYKGGARWAAGDARAEKLAGHASQAIDPEPATSNSTGTPVVCGVAARSGVCVARGIVRIPCAAGVGGDSGFVTRDS